MSILLDLFYRQNSFAPFPFAKLKTNKVTKNIVCIKQSESEMRKKVKKQKGTNTQYISKLLAYLTQNYEKWKHWFKQRYCICNATYNYTDDTPQRCI